MILSGMRESGTPSYLPATTTITDFLRALIEGRTGYSNVVEATVPDFMPGLVPLIEERVKLTAPC